MKSKEIIAKQLEVIMKYPSAAKCYKSLAERVPFPLTLKEFISEGHKYEESSRLNFLRTEILVRHSQILMEFQFLPYELTRLYKFQSVVEAHAKVLDELLPFQCRTIDLKNELIQRGISSSLNVIRDCHFNTVSNTGKALRTCLDNYGSHILPKDRENIQFFLERLYMNKISTCNLIKHHQMLTIKEKESPDVIGVVNTKFDIIEEIYESFKDAEMICQKKYGRCPELVIEDKRKILEDSDEDKEDKDKKKKKILWPCIPNDTSYPFFEIIKNSMRATCDRFEDVDKMTPVTVTIENQTPRSLDITIMDNGGGLPESVKSNLFKFNTTTAVRPNTEEEEEMDHKNGNYTVDSTVHMAGLGYGLGLSWLRTKYMNGDLRIKSSQESGITKALIRLPALPSAVELLPNYEDCVAKFYQKDKVSKEFMEGKRYHRFKPRLIYRDGNKMETISSLELEENV